MAQTFDQTKIDGELWSKFREEAKKSKKDPMRLLAQLLRDYIEQKEGERLMRESSKIAKRSGLTEDDDIEGIIRDFRKKQLAETQRATPHRS